MPSNRNYYPHGSVLFVTSRTEEGLPLVASHMMNFIIWGILARAKTLYRVKVCHFVFMYNHFHMLMVVDDPEAVSSFVGYVKAETAHAVNRLLGRQQRTIWQDGFDSPLLLSAEVTKKYIKYLYLNPAKANLVESISDYPGVSSWEMFSKERHVVKAAKVKRSDIKPLDTPAVTINEQKRLLEALKEKNFHEHDFVLEPYAWMDCFVETRDSSREAMKEELLSGINEREEEYHQERKAARRFVMGPTKLRRQSILVAYTPDKRTPRMICLCVSKERRARFIEHYRGLCAFARKVYLSWKKGDFRLKIPPGLFPPRAPSLVSALELKF